MLFTNIKLIFEAFLTILDSILWRYGVDEVLFFKSLENTLKLNPLNLLDETVFN